MAKNKLRIVPLGGLGEIGKNMTVFELGTDAFIIDTGIMFPANDMHGVDYIIPDFKYLRERDDLTIHGILYTHGHEDHVGAVSHVVEAFPSVPLYATELTSGILEVKLKQSKLLNSTTINIFQAGDTLKIGPFKIEPFHVNHSIPDCVGFGIHTPFGLVVHTGDYKFDNTPVDGKKPDYAKLASFAQRGVKLLLADSTNADKVGWTPSEAVIDEALEKVFRDAKGRILISTFASLLSRVRQVTAVAKRYKRKLAFAGTTMVEYVKMARNIGYLDIPEHMIIDINSIDQIPPSQLVLMVTGSQGEPAAVLSRLSTGRHRYLDIRQGDTVVMSSHPIPGNEEMVYRTINRLFQRGAEVIYDPIEAVHVSGHACQEEMKLMMNLVQPEYLIPVHGELRHLKLHAQLAKENGIDPKKVLVAENGSVIEVDGKNIQLTDRVPGGYVFVDGSGVGDIGRAVIRDREILARDGFMIIVVNVDEKTGRQVGSPEIISRGFVYLRDADDLLQQVRETVFESLSSTMHANGRRQDMLEESISRMLYNETKRRPMVFSIINKV